MAHDDHSDDKLRTTRALTRRTFLQGSFAAGASLAVGGLLAGCAAHPATDGDSSEMREGATADSVRETFAPTETRDVDVVVVGAGVGGMAAALQAVELGMTTVLLEKEGIAGGTSTYAEGMFAIDSHWQREAGVEYTTADTLQKVMEYHHWMANAELTKSFFDASGDTISWLESKGGVFNAVETLGPSLRTWHTYEGMGAEFTKSLFEACQENDVEVLMKTPAKQLVVKDNTVTGIIATAGSGGVIQSNA